jgi:hypothetical protein
VPSEPEVLRGGNVNPAVVRHGDVVHRRAGPWSPSVHALLRYLEQRDYPAPRVRGLDDDGEVLTFIAGDVVHPDNWGLLLHDEPLAEVMRLIRRYHDVVADYQPPADAVWHTLGADPSGSTEVLCHNDFGPFNLVRTADGWCFIDWDLVAPGRRDWELGWALQTLIPLQQEFGLSAERIGRRLRAALSAYGVPIEQWSGVMDVVIERTGLCSTNIFDGAARGEEPWLSLHRSGHADLWQRAHAYAQAHSAEWLARAAKA